MHARTGGIPLDFGKFSGQVSKELDVNGNTLRVWCLELESAGYKFERNKRQQRIYYDHNIAVLKEMKELMADGSRTLQEAVSLLLESSLSEIPENGNNALTHSVDENAGSEMVPSQRNNSVNGVVYAILEQTNEKMAELIKQQQTIALQNQEIIELIFKDKEKNQLAIESILEQQKSLNTQNQTLLDLVSKGNEESAVTMESVMDSVIEKQQQTFTTQNKKIIDVISEDKKEKQIAMDSVIEKQQLVIEQQQEINSQNQNVMDMFLEERKEKNELKEQLVEMQEKMNQMLEFVHQQSEEKGKSLFQKIFSKKSKI